MDGRVDAGMIAERHINRRGVLRGLSGVLGAALVGVHPSIAEAVTCPNACRSMVGEKDTWIHGLPIVDAHCHIFNALDVPAFQFITKVFLPHYAVHLDSSNRRKLESKIRDASADMLGRTPGFEQERAVLEARLAGESEAEALASVADLPKFARGSARSCFGADVADNIVAIKNLVSILTQFRHKNFEALVMTNAHKEPHVRVALYTPSMVDMDYWLGAASAHDNVIGDIDSGVQSMHQSSPRQQVELMEMIQRLHPGRCHGFVSFCPWRQADDAFHNAQVGEESPARRRTALETVEDAILNRGFLGVKLYPPMGFRALGNAEIQLEGFPADAAGTPFAGAFGQHLDEALRALYVFCVKHDVPIMAHAAPSNGAGSYDAGDADMGYEERAHPKYWARVLAEPGLSNLRLNLAHFGDGHHPQKTVEWREVIGDLMDAYPNVYTDLSHYPELVMDNFIGIGQRCREAAETLGQIRKSFLAGERGVKRAQRILYGSDWSMLAKEYYYADYLPVVAHMYRRKIYGVGAGAKQNARAFLSYNAREFLGLRNGNKARARIEAWYARHGLDTSGFRALDVVDD
ncbi:MAG: amidohydrolase [Hyphomicrobiaceae bacterium]|nr:amidohydrolase [Hyphomicrobiaceae bacterium]